MSVQIDKIYSKMADKVTRETINRNSNIRLSFQQYLN